MATTIPSQVGKWTVEKDPARGLIWTAAHSELERCTDQGGPVTATGASAVAMLVELVEVEAEGDFGAFCAAIESAVGADGDLEAEDLSVALLGMLGLTTPLLGIDRITRAIEHGMHSMIASHS